MERILGGPVDCLAIETFTTRRVYANIDDRLGMCKEIPRLTLTGIAAGYAVKITVLRIFPFCRDGGGFNGFTILI